MVSLKCTNRSNNQVAALLKRRDTVLLQCAVTSDFDDQADTWELVATFDDHGLRIETLGDPLPNCALAYQGDVSMTIVLPISQVRIANEADVCDGLPECVVGCPDLSD